MTSTPPEASSGPAPEGPGAGHDAGPHRVDEGPRATRDEVRDLARIRRSAMDRKVAGVAGGPVDGVFIRAPWVESLGAAARSVATFEGRVVAVRQGNLLATAFHPELTGDHRVHAMFADMVRAAG